MKKLGFTLAEILITLGIVGVVAAITLPTFTSNTQNQANSSRLSATLSTMENAFTSMIAGEGEEDMESTDFWGTRNNDPSKTQNSLGKYLKGLRCAKDLTNFSYDNNSPFKNISNGASQPTYENACQLKSGAVIIFSPKTTTQDDVTYDTMYIDVNGSSAPNKYGRDVFAVYYGANGSVQAYGSGVIGGLWSDTSSDNDTKCIDNNLGSGLGCTGRLVNNNFKMDY